MRVVVDHLGAAAGMGDARHREHEAGAVALLHRLAALGRGPVFAAADGLQRGVGECLRAQQRFDHDVLDAAVDGDDEIDIDHRFDKFHPAIIGLGIVDAGIVEQNGAGERRAVLLAGQDFEGGNVVVGKGGGRRRARAQGQNRHIGGTSRQRPPAQSRLTDSRRRRDRQSERAARCPALRPAKARRARRRIRRSQRPSIAAGTEMALEGGDHRFRRNIRVRRKAVAEAGEVLRRKFLRQSPHPNARRALVRTRLLRTPTRGRCGPQADAEFGELLPGEKLAGGLPCAPGRRRCGRGRDAAGSDGASRYLRRDPSGQRSGPPRTGCSRIRGRD